MATIGILRNTSQLCRLFTGSRENLAIKSEVEKIPI
jgi:hypothetical protein